jgi:protein gp37
MRCNRCFSMAVQLQRAGAECPHLEDLKRSAVQPGRRRRVKGKVRAQSPAFIEQDMWRKARHFIRSVSPLAASSCVGNFAGKAAVASQSESVSSASTPC